MKTKVNLKEIFISLDLHNDMYINRLKNSETQNLYNAMM